jgi:hypothetical protein
MGAPVYDMHLAIVQFYLRLLKKKIIMKLFKKKKNKINLMEKLMENMAMQIGSF